MTTYLDLIRPAVVVQPPPLNALDTLWHPDSYLTAKLPSDWLAATDTTDAAVAEIVRHVTGPGMWPGININAWSARIYVVPADQPMVPVNGVGHAAASYGGNTRAMFTAGVPIPDDAQVTADADATLVIVQPDWTVTKSGRVYTGRVYELWAAKPPAATMSGMWEASWGGRVSGTQQRKSGRPKDWWWGDAATDPWGSNGLGEQHDWLAMATHTPFTHTIIRRDEMDRGLIRHPIGLELTPAATVDQAPFVWPATARDSSSRKWCPQGARFALPPTWTVDQNLPADRRMIETAMRDYGCVINDTVTGGLYLRAEVGTTFTTPPHTLVNALPWTQLRQIQTGNDTTPTPVAA